jgi:putative tricarboxylic transport membrane protein
VDALGDLAGGFETVLQLQNLLYAALGVLIGTFVGVLPGIGPALTIALLLPITFNFEDPAGAFIMFAGIYFGGMYGGSTTSILLNTPGESASVATAIEGHAMARRGRAGPALATAAVGSFVSGTIGILLLTFLAEPVAELAVQLQPPDYFALTVLAFVAVTALVGRSLIRGMLSLFIGLFIGLVGIDQVSGQSRLTFGVDQLNNGVDVVLVAVGLFAVGEALYMAARFRKAPEDEIFEAKGSKRLSREDAQRSWRPWLRGTALGFPFGAMPTGGAEIPTRRGKRAAGARAGRGGLGVRRRDTRPRGRPPRSPPCRARSASRGPTASRGSRGGGCCPRRWLRPRSAAARARSRSDRRSGSR